MRRHRWLTMLVLVSAIALVAAGCSKKTSNGTSSGGALTIDGIQASDHGSKDVTGSSSVQVDLSNSGSDYYFSPTVLTGSAGEKITVDLKNTGNTAHTFTIDSAGIDQELQPGATGQVTVTLPASGTLVFYCKFHKTLGMEGQFSVG
jgi:plastocyanin